VINADGELQASTKLSQAAAVMGDTPGALQLRLLQTVTDVASEKNSTLVMPFPVERLRFFEHTSGEPGATTSSTPPSMPAPGPDVNASADVPGAMAPRTGPTNGAVVPTHGTGIPDHGDPDDGDR
jgi:hypothetical protein